MTSDELDQKFIDETNPPPVIRKEISRLVAMGDNVDMRLQFYFAGQCFHELSLSYHFDQRKLATVRLASSYDNPLLNERRTKVKPGIVPAAGQRQVKAAQRRRDPYLAQLQPGRRGCR